MLTSLMETALDTAQTEPEFPEAIVWADGSCAKTHGGWASVILRSLDGQNERIELQGSEFPTTNNRMELVAAIEGLSFLPDRYKVFLVSDSAYLVNVLRYKRYLKWTMKDRPNCDLWEPLIALTQKHDVTLVKVKGHGSDPLHDYTDRLAVRARIKGKDEWVANGAVT